MNTVYVLTLFLVATTCNSVSLAHSSTVKMSIQMKPIPFQIHNNVSKNCIHNNISKNCIHTFKHEIYSPKKIFSPKLNLKAQDISWQ